jgi:hypothetical protein
VAVVGFFDRSSKVCAKENFRIAFFFENFSQVRGFGDESMNDRFQLTDRRPYERR